MKPLSPSENDPYDRDIVSSYLNVPLNPDEPKQIKEEDHPIANRNRLMKETNHYNDDVNET